MPAWPGPALAFALLLALPSPASACSCVASSFEEARDAAAAIFEGVVMASEGEDGGKRVRLRVVRTWKGDDRAEHVEVRTGSNSAACGVDFEVGEGYLVYASEAEGGLFASLCSRTRPSDEAGEDFAALGAGVTPVDIHGAESATGAPSIGDPKAAEVNDGGFASCSAAGRRAGSAVGPALLLVGVLGLSARRQRRS